MIDKYPSMSPSCAGSSAQVCNMGGRLDAGWGDDSNMNEMPLHLPCGHGAGVLGGALRLGGHSGP